MKQLAPPTVVDETWLNNVQEEIAGAVEAAGATLSGADKGMRVLYAVVRFLNLFNKPKSPK